MEKTNYYANNVAQTLVQDFPGASASDAVVVSIYNVDLSTLDVDQVAMTYVTGQLWKYSWTPALANLYRITYYDPSLEVTYYEYAYVTGTVPITPVGGLGNTTFATLKATFLKLVDTYNALDLTGTNSSGEVAGICINKGLQRIYSILKASQYLEAYGSTALVSTVDQSYIELSAISNMDKIIAVKDTLNNCSLIEISKELYFRQIANPAQNTGTPFRYCRIFNRIYLDPRPTDVLTYTTEYLKVYPELASDSDTALIPFKFDDWIYKEARIEWAMMEDAMNVPPIYVRERDDAREIYLADALSNKKTYMQSGSNFRNPNRPVINPYTHLV